MMYVQTDQKLKTVMLGFGSSSIYDVGCYEVSLCNGLADFGYSFTPESLNQYLKDKNAWVGEFKNYIDVDHIANICPDIFTSFQQVAPWSDMNQLKNFLAGNYIVLGRVDARAIGGTGSHFVRVKSASGADAIIQDPWTGKTEPVVNQYGKFGCILDIRVFGVKQFVPQTPLTPTVVDQLQPVLDYYHVKTADELKHMVDEQLQFLADARKQVNDLQERYADYDQIKNTRDQYKADLDDWQKWLQQVTSSSVDDIAMNKAAVVTRFQNEDSLAEQLRQANQSLDAEKQKRQQDLDSVQTENSSLRAAVDQMKQQLGTLTTRIDQQDQVIAQQKSQIKTINWFQNVIQTFKSLIERQA